MKQTMVSAPNSSLLNYAISIFSPEVFSHPVWVRFAKKEPSISLKIVEDLLNATKKLQKDEPGTICQVLLLCAVYQNAAGQYFNALKIVQQALLLAQENHLYKEAIWAMWGKCAILIQQANYEQVSDSLVDLEAALSNQNEWILANFINVLRQQAFSQRGGVRSGNYMVSPSNQAFEEIVSFTLDWFQHWGFATQTYTSGFGLASHYSVDRITNQSVLRQSFFSIQHWQGRWHTLMLAIQGELRVQWKGNHLTSRKRRLSLWETIPRFLGLHRSDQMIDVPLKDDSHPLLTPPQLTSEAESAPPRDVARKKRQKRETAKIRKDQDTKQVTHTIPVAVQMLGSFRMAIGDTKMKLPASRGLSLLKYLVLHHQQSISREVLMDIFWPEAEPELARNNLNVAMHSLRKALRGVTLLSVIRFEDGSYSFEPNIQVWLDVEEFERCVKTGQRLEERNQLTAAINEYEAAVSLYQGDFLEQNLYEEWTILDRERLRIAYFDTLDRLSQIYFEEERYSACRSACQLILLRDPCREDAHCLLMHCYSRQEQHHLALRQYQMCAEALRGELQVEPAPETTQLYNRIRRRERV